MSFNNDKMKMALYKNKNKKDIYILSSNKNTQINSGTMNTTKMNSTSTINNNYQESQNILPNYSNFNINDKENSHNIEQQININNELNKSIYNSTNIDEIIKNEMSSAVIDSFLKQYQIKSIPMFILYLSEIWKQLSREANPPSDINLGINIFAFNKYYNLPGLIGQRLFNLINKNRKGYLSPSEFITGMCTLFCEEINSLINFIFKFYDFDEDDFITFDDIHAVLCYLPIINGFDDMIDIEEEIHNTIDDIFINKKEKIDFNTFYDLIIRKERYEFFIPLISFFYDNKPFDNEEINEFYSQYYNQGKINNKESNYKINNIINLKEFETKGEIKENKIFNYININTENNNIYRSPRNKKTFQDNNDKLFLNNTFSKNRKRFGEWTKLYINENKNKNLLDNNLNNEKEKYEKLVLNSEAFDRMKKSLPLVTGNSNILNLKTLKINKNKNSETIDKNKKNKFIIRNTNKFKKNRVKNEKLF